MEDLSYMNTNYARDKSLESYRIEEKEKAEINVRLFTYKSFRHYGGRVITPTAHICKARLIEIQQDHSYYVELLEDCAGHKCGKKISVIKHNYNVTGEKN